MLILILYMLRVIYVGRPAVQVPDWSLQVEGRGEWLVVFFRQTCNVKACYFRLSLKHSSSPLLQYANCMTVETESMADRATRAALDAENQFKKFLDDLNQYEYMKVYDDEQQVRILLVYYADNVLFSFYKVFKLLFTPTR